MSIGNIGVYFNNDELGMDCIMGLTQGGYRTVEDGKKFALTSCAGASTTLGKYVVRRNWTSSTPWLLITAETREQADSRSDPKEQASSGTTGVSIGLMIGLSLFVMLIALGVYFAYRN